MYSAIEWNDAYLWKTNHKILTEAQLHIPGLRTCGYLNKHELHEAPQRHFHKDAFEIAFVLSGELMLFCEQQACHIKGGDAFVAQPDEPHDTNGMPYSPAELFWIQLDAREERDLLFLSEEGAGNIRNELRNIRSHMLSTDNGPVTGMVRSICTDIFRNDRAESRFETASRIVSFLYLLLHFDRKKGRTISTEIRSICDFIRKDPRVDISMEILAQRAELSVSGFKHRFKKETGISPHRFILREKILYAKKVLPEANSITELSQELGFSSSSHFTEVFKKNVGMTPGAWIKQLERTAGTGPCGSLVQREQIVYGESGKTNILT